MIHTNTIESLAADLVAARSAESSAREHRILLENQVIALMGEMPESGTTSVDTANGLKISVKTAIGYKADLPSVSEIDASLIKETVKQELDAKAYEALRTKDPAKFAEVSRFVMTTPRKPAVTLKVK